MPLFTLLLLALTAPVHAAPARAPAAPITYALDASHSTVAFDLSASLHDLHGTAAQMSGSLSFVGKEGVSGRLEIPIAGLSTGLAARDATMVREALSGAAHPNIVFEVSAASDSALLSAGSGAGAVDLVGTLSIRGQRRPITVHARAAWVDGALVLTGDVPLRWTDFGIPDPSVAFSTLFPDMKVRFNVQLRPNA